MKVVAVIQARLGSSRLPAKVMLDLGGKTVLEHGLRRAARIEGVNEVVVATSDLEADDVIASMATRLGFGVVRGSEHDVLSRYALAVQETQADAVMRLTSDCPLLDPSVSRRVLAEFLDAPRVDYASNTLSRRLPRGLDTEVIATPALLRAHREATDPSEREHVTMHLYRNKERFACLDVASGFADDLSHHRWTLDTLDDYRFLYRIVELLGEEASHAATARIVALLSQHPELQRINSHVQQKA